MVVDLALATDAILSRATFAGAAPVVLADLTLSGYQAPAVMLEAPGELHLAGCVLSANTGGYPVSGGLIDGGEGLVDLQDTALVGNTGRFLIYTFRGRVTLQRVSILDNDGDLGLTASNAQLSLADVTATGNAVTNLIEAYGGSLSLDRSSLTGNQAGSLYLVEVEAVVSASTFADNVSSHSIALSSLGGTFTGTDLDIREPWSAYAVDVGPGWNATFDQCSFAGGSIGEGRLMPLASAVFRCCELDLARWQLYGTYSVDNDGCSVPAETTSFGSLKAMFR